MNAFSEPSESPQEWPHCSVLLDACLEALNPVSGGHYLDATLGMGGHSEAILGRSGPESRVWGGDRDPLALEIASNRMMSFGGRFVPIRSNFADIADHFPPKSLNGILMDLGVSSPQLDRSERGFSFMREGPLDMRMDPADELTAGDLINESSEKELASIFHYLGEDRHSRYYAKRIVQRRLKAPFNSTTELAEFLQSIRPGKPEKIHAATRVFQALRMRVNNELESLRAGLKKLGSRLAPGGRMVILTFHSLEAKVVKQFGDLMAPPFVGRSGPMKHGEASEKDRLRSKWKQIWLEPGEDWPSYQLKWTQRKGRKANLEEIAQNPRSRSAQLRVLERVDGMDILKK